MTPKDQKKLLQLLAAVAGVAVVGYAVKAYVIPKIKHLQYKKKNPDLPGTEK